MDDPGSPRLLVVVAHPDDETFGCGSILRRAADECMVTAVLCATRGEAGESAIDVAPGELASVREAETRAAGEVLGVSQIEFLDFQDSGMSGPAGNATLVAAPMSEVAQQIRERVEGFRPDVVVTLEAGTVTATMRISVTPRSLRSTPPTGRSPGFTCSACRSR